MVRRLALALVLGAMIATMAGPAAASASDAGRGGTVYIQTNEAAGNAVAAFARGSNGALTPAGVFPTGGLGSGAGLGSQGAVALSGNGRLLLAVNAGSDEISSFRVARDGSLELAETAPSGGDMPISVTIHGRLVYVLNAGGAGNISGFTVGSRGSLDPLAASTHPLSAAGTAPAQVEFSPDGTLLVVTEKMANVISTYRIRANGTAKGPSVQASSGMTPFGFEFDGRGRLIVSEAFGGAADASATSSYGVSRSGHLSVLSGSVGTTETAACWVAVTGNGRFAYVTNTGSGTVTGYAIRNNGRLSLLDRDGVTGVTGAGSSPIDVDDSPDSRYLYVLNDGTDSIDIFRIDRDDGDLRHVGELEGLPGSSAGLVSS